MEENQQPDNKILIYILVVFFAFFVGTSLFLIVNNKNKPPVQEATNTNNTIKQENLALPTAVPSVFSLLLQPDMPSSKATTSAQFKIRLIADSKDKNIVGYDALLFYDPLNFEFIKAESSLPDYQISAYKKDNYIALTGTKNLQSPASPLNNVGIATLVFQPKKAGAYSFFLSQSSDNGKTDMITDKTEVLTPTLNKLPVEVN